MSVPPKAARSGEHPAVQAYRNKLESIAENTKAQELDEELAKYLEAVRTPIPPPLEPRDTTRRG